MAEMLEKLLTKKWRKLGYQKPKELRVKWNEHRIIRINGHRAHRETKVKDGIRTVETEKQTT